VLRQRLNSKLCLPYRPANCSLHARNPPQLASPNKRNARHAPRRSCPSAFAGCAVCSRTASNSARAGHTKLGSLHSWSGAQGRVVAFSVASGKWPVRLRRCSVRAGAVAASVTRRRCCRAAASATRVHAKSVAWFVLPSVAFPVQSSNVTKRGNAA
jgi:hypothetical protein